jgi:hypothetical protein
MHGLFGRTPRMRGVPRWSMLHLAQAIMIACDASLERRFAPKGALPL